MARGSACRCGDRLHTRTLTPSLPRCYAPRSGALTLRSGGGCSAMPSASRHQRWEETVDVLGRRFVLRVEGPVPPGRYEIRIWEGRRRIGSRPYLKAPIRGRDADEARDRALEVLHTYVGLEQFRRLVEEIVAQVAPGARVDVTERVREVVITLQGPYTLRTPLVLSRDEILDPATSADGLRAVLRAHFEAHVMRRQV